jgi:acyl transferase domain-containing protein
MRTAVGRVKPVFVFSGAGPQWWGMGQELLEREPVFARVAEECDAIFQRVAGWSILAEMSAPEDQSLVTSAHIAPSANFILQAALSALWRDEGIEPAAAVGHSSGEIAAAYLAGVLGLADAIRISYRFGQSHAKRIGQGAMLAVGMSSEEARRVLAANGGRVSVAAVNSPSAVTLAGGSAELERIAAKLTARKVFNRFLRVDVAYHSPDVEPAKAELRARLCDLRSGSPSFPLYSTVTGRLAGKQPWNAGYWCDNVRETVLFENAVASMIRDGHRVFLEVGAHPVLSAAVGDCLAAQGVQGTVLASLRRGQPERATFLAALDALLEMERGSPSSRERRLSSPRAPMRRAAAGSGKAIGGIAR